MSARVFVTGLGGELGTRVALLLEQDRSVRALAGIDLDPPRRRLRRTGFTPVDPRDRARTAAAIRAFRPTAVVHLGVYEPDARCGPRAAQERTAAAADAVLGAVAENPSIESVVVRSGIEVYGRGRGAVTVPDESTALGPRSAFGRSLTRVEWRAGHAATAGAVVTVLRLAPVIGPHVPSPLGRYLRLPVVPFNALADPPFSVVHHEDAARAMVTALLAKRPGTFNVVAPGAVTISQAARLGGRVPLPLAGPSWVVARRVADLAGAPVPDHLVELLGRGRTADGGRAEAVLGIVPATPTREVVRRVHEWAQVTRLRVVPGDAA
jgi:UDP-glucose 4-epimerase